LGGQQIWEINKFWGQHFLEVNIFWGVNNNFFGGGGSKILGGSKNAATYADKFLLVAMGGWRQWKFSMLITKTYSLIQNFTFYYFDIHLIY
jgi:hypothetical protein